MRLASDCRVGYAVRMSRLVSSRSATASHMSFGTSGVEALLARLLVDAVKTGHLLDLEAQYLHGVGAVRAGRYLYDIWHLSSYLTVCHRLLNRNLHIRQVQEPLFLQEQVKLKF